MQIFLWLQWTIFLNVNERKNESELLCKTFSLMKERIKCEYNVHHAGSYWLLFFFNLSNHENFLSVTISIISDFYVTLKELHVNNMHIAAR